MTTEPLTFRDLQQLERAFNALDVWRRLNGNQPLDLKPTVASLQRQYDLPRDAAAGLYWLWGVTWNPDTTPAERAALALNVGQGSTR